MSASSPSLDPLRNGPFKSTWLSDNKQGLSCPLAVSRSRLQVLQKCRLKAGIKPIDVLQIATLRAAEAVGAEDHLGTIESGKLADIVLLDKNPLEDIKNTQSIWRVIKGGWVFDPEELKPEKSSDKLK